MAATVPPQVFVWPEHKPGDSFDMDFVYDGTREGLIAAAMASLATAPEDVISSTLTWQGETIVLDARLARVMTTN